MTRDEAEKEFAVRCATPSDIHEHLPVLRKYSSRVESVVEFGVRRGNSTVALLAGSPFWMVSYDIERLPEVERLFPISKAFGVNFQFRQEDVLKVRIPRTALLFIDTRHTAYQLYHELERHWGRVMHYIILHDTETFRFCDELPYISPAEEEFPQRGLWPVVEEFVDRRPFEILDHYPNNNGLTVLRRC